MSNLKQNGKLRWIPSFLRRQGQMTPGQKRAFREHWNQFGIEFQYGEIIDLASQFPQKEGPLYLEIGFGMGENPVYLAGRYPEARILAIEVHKPGIGALLKQIADHGIMNIRVMRGDARLILSDYLPDNTQFDRISVLFPDPWPDEESGHRRIIQDDLIELLESKITRNGFFHIATDVDVYRDHSLKIIGHRSGWQRVDQFELTDFRGPTGYETKGIEKGHAIHDLLFCRDPSIS